MAKSKGPGFDIRPNTPGVVRYFNGVAGAAPVGACPVMSSPAPRLRRMPDFYGVAGGADEAGYCPASMRPVFGLTWVGAGAGLM